MNEPIIVVLATFRGRTLDQPDLAEHLTAQNIWQAWTPLEDLLELPPAVEELIDAASAQLGHFSPAGTQRKHAWESAQAAAWGLARPLPGPLPPEGFRWPSRRSWGSRSAPRTRGPVRSPETARDPAQNVTPPNRGIKRSAMSALLRRRHPPPPSLAAERPVALAGPASFVLRSRPQDDGAMWPAHATRCRQALPAALQWSAPLLDAHQPLTVPCSEEQVRALFHWLDSLPNTERVSVCCERRSR